MRMVAAIVGLLILAASPALWSQEPETNVQALESLATRVLGMITPAGDMSAP